MQQTVTGDIAVKKRKHIPKKVTIEIYDEEDNGKPLILRDGSNSPYTSVGFSASTYGSGSPCTSEEEIRKAIDGCKAWIIREGDVPIIQDKRKLGINLLNFQNGKSNL